MVKYFSNLLLALTNKNIVKCSVIIYCYALFNWNDMIPVVTIDGPSGSGKGTIGQLLAKDLGWHYLDSGALYRVLAFDAVEQAIELFDERRLADLARKLPVKFIPQPDGSSHILLDGKDISPLIRTEEIGNAASKVGTLPTVRAALLDCQRAFRQAPGLVTDGRDMGTVIFPDAPLKIFLMAVAEERARRRYQQLKERGISVSLADLCNELIERDKRDQQRQVAPLMPAADAVIIDTTALSIGEVLQQVKGLANKMLSLHKR